MSQVVAEIEREAILNPRTQDRQFFALLSLADGDGKILDGSPRRFPSFEAVAALLVREAAIVHETLQNAHAIYESGSRPARIQMNLNEAQIAALGFRLPENSSD